MSAVLAHCGSRRWCEVSVHSPPEHEQYGGVSENKENSADSLLLAQRTSSKYGQQQEKRAVKEASLQATMLSHVEPWGWGFEFFLYSYRKPYPV